MSPGIILSVAAGGATGAVARYLLASQIGSWTGPGFPWGTFVVNVLGCAIMGLLTETFALAWSPSPEMRAFLTVGILGGFTTFSAFSLDAVLLMERNDWLPALLYVVGSVVLSLLAFFAVMRLVRVLFA